MASFVLDGVQSMDRVLRAPARLPRGSIFMSTSLIRGRLLGKLVPRKDPLRRRCGIRASIINVAAIMSQRMGLAYLAPVFRGKFEQPV